MRDVQLASAHGFITRLQEFMEIEGSDPAIAVADDRVLVVGEDGTLDAEAHGAQAVLIIAGPTEGRKAALARLLALIETS